MNDRRIALFGGSFNPPGVHHLRIAEALVEQFPRVAVVPCGFRSDKLTTNDIDPEDRLAMVELTFMSLPGINIDADDISTGQYTCNHELDRKYRDKGYEPWHVIGTDLIAGGAANPHSIHHWKHGEQLWNRLNWLILMRSDYAHRKSELPSHHRILTLDTPGSSTMIRGLASQGTQLNDHVVPAVERYIRGHRLYQPQSEGEK